MNYIIVISEEQRAILQDAINRTFHGMIPPDVESPDAILFDMLRDLPIADARARRDSDRGCLHDFTL